MEPFYHVSRRIRAGITSEKRGLGGIWGTSSILTRDFRNLMVPLDRARRVVLGTRLEQFYHVPRRIRAGITLLGM